MYIARILDLDPSHYVPQGLTCHRLTGCDTAGNFGSRGTLLFDKTILESVFLSTVLFFRLILVFSNFTSFRDKPAVCVAF